MKVLVTGGSGFLGSHIVDACVSRGYQVIATVRQRSDTRYLETLTDPQVVAQPISLRQGELSDVDFLQRVMAGVDAVIHCAARVSEVGDWQDFYHDNVALTNHLLAQAQKSGVRHFVYVSSPSVVAELCDQININEAYPYPRQFINYYCHSKALAEQCVLQSHSSAFTTCAIRPRAVWGPRDLSGPFAKLLKRVAHNKLKDLSDGRQIHSSLCYVKNAAAACVKAATAQTVSGQAYFVTDPEPVDLWPFINSMAEAFKLPRVTQRVPLKWVKPLVSFIEAIWQIPYLQRNIPPPVSHYGLGLIIHSATYDIAAANRDLDLQADIIPFSDALAEYQAWVNNQGGSPPI